MVFAQKPAKLRAAMADILENAEADLTPQMRSLINMLWDEWKLVEQQIKRLDLELERISPADALRRIVTIRLTAFAGRRDCEKD